MQFSVWWCGVCVLDSDGGCSFQTKGGNMVTIPIDHWLREAKHVGEVVKKAIQVTEKAGLDVGNAKIGLELWQNIITNMEVVRASRNSGGEIKVV